MATYLDNAGVTQILTKIKSLLAKKAEITAIPTKVSQLTNDSLYQNAAEVIAQIDTKLGELSLDVEDTDKNYVYSVKQKTAKSPFLRRHSLIPSQNNLNRPTQQVMS